MGRCPVAFSIALIASSAFRIEASVAADLLFGASLVAFFGDGLAAAEGAAGLLGPVRAPFLLDALPTASATGVSGVSDMTELPFRGLQTDLDFEVLRLERGEPVEAVTLFEED